MTREEIQAIYNKGPEAVIALVQKLLNRTKALEKTVELNNSVFQVSNAEEPGDKPQPQTAPGPCDLTFLEENTDLGKIDCYQIEKRLGSGGAGVVYRAKDEITGETVAIKLLQLKQGLGNTALLKRFSQEVKIHLQLSHPNIVRFIKSGIYQESPYLVMEFVDGVSLEKMVDTSGKLSPRRALSLILPIVGALDYALSLKIIHRDIKPANILADINRGKIKLADMGLGKMVESSGITLSNEVIGTPKYMSPEQIIASDKVDYRTDIYALGATLYHMLTGIPPFEGKNVFLVMRLKLTTPPAPLEQLVPGLLPSLVHLVNKMMAIAKEDRFQSYKEIQEGMQKILRSLSSGA